MSGFDHAALLYRDQREYLAGTLPFIRAALAAEEPVLVAAPGARLARLRDALRGDAARVRFEDLTVSGANPGRVLPGVLLAFADAHARRPVRMVGETVWPGRTPLEYPACVQHEALTNLAFAERAATLLCPYDVSGLAPQVVEDAYRTHPSAVTPATRERSTRYGDPVAVARSFNLPLPEPPSHAATIPVSLDRLAKIRTFVTDAAVMAGLGPTRADDLMIAVNELATNTAAHTPGNGMLAVWTEDPFLVCQVRDSGHITAPLAGRTPAPPRSSHGGRGLLLVNHLCDLVRVHTRPGATTIRLHMRLT